MAAKWKAVAWMLNGKFGGRAIRAACALALAASMMPAPALAQTGAGEAVAAAIVDLGGAGESELDGGDGIKCDVSREYGDCEDAAFANATFDAYVENKTISVPMNACEQQPDGYAYRLLVGLQDGHVPAPGDVVLASHGNVYLLGYDGAGDLSKAQLRYAQYAEFASVDGVLDAQDGQSAAEVNDVMMAPDDGKMLAGETPLDSLDGAPAQVSAKTPVAIVDTGAPDASNVRARKSVIGDAVDDDNGHGTAMLETILAENPAAEVVSIKALDSQGHATVSSAYAGIEEAIASGAKVINLSISAKAQGGCAAIDAAVKDAIEAGCTVVAAAGNDGDDASNYSPANAPGALTVGAVDADGKARPSSNWGATVDSWVEAETTSYAAARVSGRLSLVGKDDIGAPDAVGSDGSLAERAPETEAERENEEFLASASHSTFGMSAHIYGTSSWSSTSGITVNVYRSINRPANTRPFDTFSASAVPNGLSGTINYSRSTSSGYYTWVAMSLTGTMAQAYSINYIVHGQDQAGSGGNEAYNGARASHNNAAVDGVGAKTTLRYYANAVQARFQNADGTWSGYTVQRTGNYGYLQTVPAWSRAADTRYQAASMAAYTASYAAKTTSIDVYRQSYTASFDSQGGTDMSGESRTLLCEAPLGELPVPTKIGFEFAGWYTDPTGGTEVTADSTMPLANTTYYAHWTRTAWVVGFDAAGGEGYMGEREVVLGEGYAMPACSYTRPGYEFKGWKAEGGVDVLGEGEACSIDGDVVFAAQWEPYQLTFSMSTADEARLIVHPDGSITGPDAGDLGIENLSRTGIEVSGLRAVDSSDTRIVAEPGAAGEYSLEMALEGATMDLADYVSSAFEEPPVKMRAGVGETIEIGRMSGKAKALSIGPEGLAGGKILWELAQGVVEVTFVIGDGAGTTGFVQKANAGVAFALPAVDGVVSWTVEEAGQVAAHAPGEKVSFGDDATVTAVIG